MHQGVELRSDGTFVFSHIHFFHILHTSERIIFYLSHKKVSIFVGKTMLNLACTSEAFGCAGICFCCLKGCPPQGQPAEGSTQLRKTSLSRLSRTAVTEKTNQHFAVKCI